jgi:hypothetical protein
VTEVELDRRLEKALRRYAQGEAPLIMHEVAPLPVTLTDGRRMTFGDLSPDDLEVVAEAIRVRAERDFRAVEGEWEEEDG